MRYALLFPSQPPCPYTPASGPFGRQKYFAVFAQVYKKCQVIEIDVSAPVSHCFAATRFGILLLIPITLILPVPRPNHQTISPSKLRLSLYREPQISQRPHCQMLSVLSSDQKLNWYQNSILASLLVRFLHCQQKWVDVRCHCCFVNASARRVA